MKYTVSITQQCNLRCSYCYIDKNNSVLSQETAKKIVDFIFSNTPTEEKINIGFFGGEPLTEFETIKMATELIEKHPSYNPARIELAVVTNGTVFSDEISDFLIKHNINFCLSCDGPAFLQDKQRPFASGKGSSKYVEKTIKQALDKLPSILVNAVYGPDNLRHLPSVVEYFASLGIKQIYLNPDYSAKWTQESIDMLPQIYENIGELYAKHYLEEDPLFVSLIDSKITVILREGYQKEEKCQMGYKELAFTPSGNIYPCERLIGSDDGEHAIGHISIGLNQDTMSCKTKDGSLINPECLLCGIQEYCMNWCGCSNFFATGFYNRVSQFTCASEKSAIKTASNVFETLNNKAGHIFVEHLAGRPALNSLLARR